MATHHRRSVAVIAALLFLGGVQIAPPLGRPSVSRVDTPAAFSELHVQRPPAQEFTCNKIALAPEFVNKNRTFNPSGVACMPPPCITLPDPVRLLIGPELAAITPPVCRIPSSPCSPIATGMQYVLHRPQQPCTHCTLLRIPRAPAGVFDPERGWIVVLRHEEGQFAPTFPLTMRMGRDPNALNLTLAAETQCLLAMDDATLGPAAAKARGNHPWVKSEDLR